jgi:hypothetical protein
MTANIFSALPWGAERLHALWGQMLGRFFTRVSGHILKGGDSVGVQTHGRHGQYNPPLPIIATSGGWDQQARQWGHRDSLP